MGSWEDPKKLELFPEIWDGHKNRTRGRCWEGNFDFDFDFPGIPPILENIFNIRGTFSALGTARCGHCNCK